MTSNHEHLEHSIEQLQQENAELRRENAELKQRIEELLGQIQELKRNRFGCKSEKMPKEKATESSKPHTRVRKERDWSKYPRSTEIIAVPEEQRTCNCGCEKKLVRYESREMLDYKPAEITVIEQKREVLACPNGCEITTAPTPLHILPKVCATENLLAAIVTSKLHDRQPFYHLEKYALAADISRETMARWAIQLAAKLQPLFNLLKEKIIDYDVAHIDATAIQVLREPNRNATTKSYMYCILGREPGKEVVLYAYNALEHKQFVESYLSEFSGFIHLDADNFFDALTSKDTVTPAFCHAHARRKFESITKQASKNGLAAEALRFYKRLYAVEKQAKEDNLTPSARLALRKDKSASILKEFHEWLLLNSKTTLPKTPLGKAFTYILKRWSGFTTFMHDGRVELDNNHNEREIKPLVIARKNFMFCNSIEGASALAMHMTLIRTALAHGLNPYDYLVQVLKTLPLCKELADFEALLPWNIKMCQNE